MEYTAKFNIDCISKRGMISRKSGEVDITTDVSIFIGVQSILAIAIHHRDFLEKIRKI